ncbi:MAG: excinuclease ABC subunit UvrC, partial [Candidatus Hydrogenedentes bacterium]|nr:excinuclease ABC subunit UvrC [Candidatus Hydrogenedentota bacterium]
VGTPSKRKSPQDFLDSFDVSSVSTSAGCYLMRDEKDRVIYIGKAKNLRNRVRTYINAQDSRYSVKFLMRRVAHIDFFLTTNDKEAVLLENSLIKQFKPRYNVQLKDDKTYVSLRVNMKEDFPQLTVVRKHRNDGASYFGPYASAHGVRDTLRQIHRMFPLRTCSDHVMNNRTRPCIYYQMKQCAAPCVGRVTPEAYGEIVGQVVMVLSGRSKELEKLLNERIREKAAVLKFEEAAELRDRLRSLQQMLERQRTVEVPGVEDRDVVGYHMQGRYVEIQVIFYRGGKMLGGRSFSFKQREMPIEEILGSFLLQFYSEAPVIPAEILVPEPIEEADTLEEILSEKRGACKVAILRPQRGEKRALVDLAARNAKNSFREKQLAEKAQVDLLENVKEKLKLRAVPNRIECFDISTHQGEKTVGSMVVFEGGVANKDRYRRFSIKQVEGQDDFASMREVLMRRYKRAIEESDLPDLVLIDGGKGQLNVALAALGDLGIEDLEAVSIAKSRLEERGGRSPERFFLPGRSNPVILAQNAPVVHLMARIRDEAHRFAISYHRSRRVKGTIRSTLTDISGIGPKLAKKLLNRLGSIAKIRELSASEIADVPGINNRLARAIEQHLASAPGAKASGGRR